MSPAALRRVLHVASGSVVLLVPLASLGVFRLVTLAVAAAGLGIELARLNRPAVAAWLTHRIPVFRAAEARWLSGASWLWLGFAIAAWFPAPAAIAGILVAATADPAASLVGERVAPAGRKTWAGTGAAFVVAAGLLMLLGTWWAPAAGVGAVAAVAERWPGPFDDNLVLAPLVAGALTLAA